MKITVFLLFIGFLQLSAATYSQNTKLDLSLKEVSLREVFEAIEEQSDLRFLFRDNVIDSKQHVTINMKGTLDQILKELTKDNKIEYQVLSNNLIAISNPNSSEISIQQQKTIAGKVTDSSGASLLGVTVVIKSTTNGTITDADGNYTLTKVPDNAILVFSFVGMKTQEIAAGGKTVIDVILREDAIGIEEVVAVGYGTQTRAMITGSISSVQGEDLVLSPVASASNTLNGRLAGVITKQTQGLPGQDGATINIRGFGSPLVIVDGVEGSLDGLDPSSIESVSVLKDGAAAIYGSRASNGVLLVTTKRGGTRETEFTLNTSFSGQSYTNFPMKVNAGQYATLKREAHLHQEKPEADAPYTEAEIQKFYDGSDPWNYPNTDWVKETVREWAPQQEHNLSVRGGSEKIKFYGLLGGLRQETMWKGNGGNYQRFNLLANIDMKLTESLDLQLNIQGNERHLNYAFRSETAQWPYLFQDLWFANPTKVAHYPDPTKLPYVESAVPLYAVINRDISGYDDTETSQINSTLALTYKIKPVPGLSVKVLGNYRKYDSLQKLFSKGIEGYTYSPDDDTYTKVYDTKSATNVELRNGRNRDMSGQFSLNYDRTFNQDHHVSAIALYEVNSYYYDNFRVNRTGFLTTEIDQLSAASGTIATSGGAEEMGRVSYVGRLNYSYKDKYLLESTFRADASAKFPPAHRWALFPSVSLGWRMSEEDFIAGLGLFDNLKLRVNYGQMGSDASASFQYLTGYTNVRSFGSGYEFGTQTVSGLFATNLPNPDLIWTRATIYNFGIDFSMWQRKLYGEIDAFYRRNTGLPAKRLKSLPTSFGASLPDENLNTEDNRGFELKIGTAGKLQDFTYDINAIISWARAKYVKWEESPYEDPDQIRINKLTGRWKDVTYGYVSDGVFTSQEEIDALDYQYDRVQNSVLRPGDIRFVDTNSDKVLDWKDQVEIGNGSLPLWGMGLNMNFTWKNFDLGMLWQGNFGFNYNVVLTENMRTYFNLRWTEDNNDPNASVVRHGSAAASSNGRFSDFYYQKADYLRLKTVALGYNLPKAWMNKVKMKNVRIYVSGTNLLTFSNLNKYGLDPEVPAPSSSSYGSAFSYPQQKTITLGANVTF